MSDRARQALAFVIAIGMVIAVASAPTVAQVADPSSEQVFELAALNADTVDGRHATKYTTTRGKRAGMLVATNSNGYLPSNILKPQWRVIQNMPGGFKDGVDDVGYTSWVHPQTFTVDDSEKSIVISHLRRYDVGVQIMPITYLDEVILIEESFRQGPHSDIEHWLRVKRHPNSPSATVKFRIRTRVFDVGIEPASTRAISDMVKVRVAKRR